MPQCACVRYGFTRTTFLSFASREVSITTAVTNQKSCHDKRSSASLSENRSARLYTYKIWRKNTHSDNYKNCCHDKRSSISSTNQASFIPFERCRSIRQHLQLIVNGAPIRKISEQESAVPLHPRRQHLREF